MSDSKTIDTQEIEEDGYSIGGSSSDEDAYMMEQRKRTLGTSNKSYLLPTSLLRHGEILRK